MDVPDEQRGTLPSEQEPDPAPEAERPTVDEVASERGATGEPIGTDNIREGRVGGVMGGPHPQGGQGEGG
jgi:hypothetical protein